MIASHGSDSSLATSKLLLEYWRTAPSWQKLQAINDLNAALKILALSDLRRRHPTESDAQLQRRLATRWLGAELAERVYGPHADGHIDATE
ncbi:hypothetical protein [Candidatus Viridilinea mediisalina]|uniref:hypothetical protein n=1 Tax=Candidatus Viridilinea mediisalina TaxID=2024553 RepID=UPI000BEA67C2|nr:hypothetical protein [Candidatus Viridilinea mediisalina]